jgi:succinate dehydrogenase/fumarate reductase flavoprotein subunit
MASLEIMKTLSYDLLVVGSGYTGLRAAYDASKTGLSVLLVSKGSLCSGSSFYPLTSGIRAQLPLNENDKKDYLEELLDSGDTMADCRMYSILVDEITTEVERLSELGISVHYPSGRAACFAKKERRLAGWSDWDGIRNNVSEILATFENLSIFSNCDLAKLLVRDKKICGALLIDEKDSVIQVNTPCVILATGGYCGLYEHSLNTDDVCGIGHSIALDAGAKLINLEFMQFIPGGLSPVYKLLFCETSLWYCSSVCDEKGKSVLEEYLPSEVTVEKCLEERSRHGPFTTRDDSKYFDLAMMEQSISCGKAKGFFLHFDPSITTNPNELVAEIPRLYKSHGIDLARDSISIAPFAHCSNGGILINEHCQTGIAGLLAAGEVAGGLHGADRHGGAASAACLVFGARASLEAISYISSCGECEQISRNEAQKEFSLWLEGGKSVNIPPEEILQILGKKLWLTANVIRSEALTFPSLEWVRLMRRGYNPRMAIHAGSDVKISLKAFHALRTAEALLSAILLRKESRGGHFRQDFPNRDDSLNYHRITVQEQEDSIILTYQKQ